MAAAQLRQRKATDIEVTDKANAIADAYDETNLPGFTPPPHTIKEVSHFRRAFDAIDGCQAAPRIFPRSLR